MDARVRLGWIEAPEAESEDGDVADLEEAEQR